MSQQDKVKKAMEDVKSSFQVEGIELTEQHDTLVLARLKGEITHEEFLKKAKEAAKNV